VRGGQKYLWNAEGKDLEEEDTGSERESRAEAQSNFKQVCQNDGASLISSPRRFSSYAVIFAVVLYHEIDIFIAATGHIDQNGLIGAKLCG
jgi:hypothetical protein